MVGQITQIPKFGFGSERSELKISAAKAVTSGERASLCGWGWHKQVCPKLK